MARKESATFSPMCVPQHLVVRCKISAVVTKPTQQPPPERLGATVSSRLARNVGHLGNEPVCAQAT